MKIKRFLLIVIAFLSISLVTSAQYKIAIECKNATHDTYNFTGWITDGTSSQFYNVYVAAGATVYATFNVSTPNWYRQSARITHTSGINPVADFWMNDPGPYQVYGPNNSLMYNIVYQDAPLFYLYSKFYYYRIEAN